MKSESGNPSKPDPERLVPLKNGASASVAEATIIWRQLCDLQDERPELLAELIDLAQGHVPSRALIAGLNHLRGIVSPAGFLKPVARDVLMSSLRESENKEGAVLAQPFVQESSEVRQILKDQNALEKRNWKRLLRKLLRPDDDDPGTHGPMR